MQNIAVYLILETRSFFVELFCNIYFLCLQSQLENKEIAILTIYMSVAPKNLFFYLAFMLKITMEQLKAKQNTTYVMETLQAICFIKVVLKLSY